MNLFRPSLEQSLISKATHILAALAFLIVWYFVMALALTLAHDHPYGFVKVEGAEAIGHAIFWGCISAPIWEEVAYRYAPIKLARILHKWTGSPEFYLPFVLIASAAFGWLHDDGPKSIWYQGVGGVVFSWVYIRNGYSLVSSMITHCAWNAFVYFGIPYFFPNVLDSFNGFVAHLL